MAADVHAVALDADRARYAADGVRFLENGRLEAVGAAAHELESARDACGTCANDDDALLATSGPRARVRRGVLARDARCVRDVGCAG